MTETLFPEARLQQIHSREGSSTKAIAVIPGKSNSVHMYGEAPKGEDFLVIGHESLGIVERVGHKVNSLKRGDMVVCTVRRPDGCINCQAGEFDLCLDGNCMERGIRGHHAWSSLRVLFRRRALSGKGP